MVKSASVVFGRVAALFTSLWVIQGVGIVSAAGPQQQPVSLEPGRAVSEQLAAGQSRVFRASAQAGQHLRISVEQFGIKVALSISGPDGRQVAEVVSHYGREGPVAASIIAEATGDYTAEVRSTEKGAPEGKFEIKIEALKEATPADRSRVTAQKIAGEGRRLQSRPDSASWKKAIDRFRESLPHWQAAADRLAEANTLQSIGLTYRSLGDMVRAIESYESALSIQQAVGDRRGEASTLSYLGIALAYEGNLQRALACYEQAQGIWKAVGYKPGIADSHNLIGGIYDLRGELKEALRYYEIAFTLRQELSNPVGAAVVLNNIAAVYDKLGETQKTIETYGRAVTIFEQATEYRRQAVTLHNLGYTYASLGDSQTALQYYEQAREVRKKANDPLNEAVTIAGIGRLYSSGGDFRKALEYYNQALAIQKEANSSWQAYTLINIGQAYVSLGEIEKAITYYEQALKLLREAGDRQGEASALDRLGQAFTLSGQSQRALAALQSALPLWRAVGDRNGEATTLYGIARVESGQGNLVEARKWIQAAIEIAETMRSKVANQELRTFYLASVRDYYDLGIDLLMQMHRRSPSDGLHATAFEMSEQGRARSLLEMLTEAGINIREGVDPNLLQRERSLQQQLNVVAEKQRQLLGGKHTREQSEALEKELKAILTSYQEVQASIRSNNPNYAHLTNPQTLGLKDIQQQLDSDTLLLEFSLGDERSYLWAVSQNSIASFELPARFGIEAASRQVYDSLNAQGRFIKGEREEERFARIAKAESEFPQAAGRLAEMLIAPAAALLNAKRLLIVPDGALQYVPFAALPLPASAQEGAGRQQAAGGASSYVPLVVSHEVVNLPSASALAVHRRTFRGRKPAPKAVAVLADPVYNRDDVRLKRESALRPKGDKSRSTTRDLDRGVNEVGLADMGVAIPRLPFSRQEAREIIKHAAAEQSKLSLDFEASRSVALSADLSQYRVVHFATHGLLNGRHPELSGIVLSLFDKQGQLQNGFLRLHEIYNLKLPAELVVLSACQTGLGKEIRGEGIVGLTRGFMYAGAARVIASLWKVDDAATAELMSRFYKHMFGGQRRPAEALRMAQIEMHEKRAWRSPYYWAAFVLQGEWK